MDYFEEGINQKEIENKIQEDHFTDDELEEYYTTLRDDETEELNFNH